ncbi:MAG: 16S rRNA processing protein RimM [Caulobacteraceae bacterium]|nr:16S rRNA processing protein RimM [Caulobacteraceae bacterium]
MAPGGCLVLVGQVAGAFGVKGEVRVTAFTEDPLSLLAYGPLLDETGAPVLTLRGGRAEKGAVVGVADEIGSREAAQAMRGLRLYAPRDRLPPPGDEEYYLVDLIGLEAVSPTGERLGRVKSVADFGAGDLLEIEPPDHAPTWWAPFTRDTVPDVDLARGRIIVARSDGADDPSQ